VRREAGLIALLSPPFDKMLNDPGYIKGYVPGVRENGGQYTHAALWVVLAHLMRGDGDEAASLLRLINPISHGTEPEAVKRYKVEPYVVAADVYAAEPHVGRGGWTWYTGSAGWFYRVVVMWLLGIRYEFSEGSRFLVVEPCIPKDWPGCDAVVRDASGDVTTTYRIRVENPRGVNRGVDRIELDGVVLEQARVPLGEDGGDHDVVVRMLGG
jgi:cyclic beta-1,2-glucan synthetase